jgi:hypothetical protein
MLGIHPAGKRDLIKDYMIIIKHELMGKDNIPETHFRKKVFSQLR